MDITVHSESNRDLGLRAFKHVLRRRVGQLRLFAGYLLALAVLLVFLASGDDPTAYYGAVLVAALALSMAVNSFQSVPRSWDSSAKFLSGPAEHRLRDDGLETIRPAMRTWHAWSMVESVEEIPGALILRFTRMQFTYIPTADLTAEHIGQIKAAVAAAQATPAQTS